jgi:hypothetical protein
VQDRPLGDLAAWLRFDFAVGYLNYAPPMLAVVLGARTDAQRVVAGARMWVMATAVEAIPCQPCSSPRPSP